MGIHLDPAPDAPGTWCAPDDLSLAVTLSSQNNKLTAYGLTCQVYDACWLSGT